MATRKLAGRSAALQRHTTETQIDLKLSVDGQGRYNIATGIRFLDHMLELFARHGGFDLDLICKGDLDVDQHHTVEDIGIALGEAFSQALGDKKGILRAGYFLMPVESNSNHFDTCLLRDRHQGSHANRRRLADRIAARLF